jgi:hypothetical protein
MARIALIAGMAVAGAVLSVMTGGLGAFAVGAWIPDIMAGLAAGAAVGQTLGSLVFQPRLNGPRLADTQIMNSTNGAPIPFGYGGFRIAGQVIWSSGIVETETNQSQSGGKGFGSPTSTVYTYTISVAVAFCEGPANITRIWGDSKLIYDTTSKGAVSSDTLDTGLQNTGKGDSGAQTTVVIPIIYSGTSDQMPDPTIQAAQGIDQTPAFRDLCYIVYNNLPIADFGNRLPNLRAEVSTATVQAYIKDTYPPIDLDVPTLGGGGGTSVYNQTFCYVDPVGRVAILLDSAGATAQAIDLATTNTEPLEAWQPSTIYSIGDQILDSAGNVETVTHIIGGGTSGSSASVMPVWVVGGEMEITVDNSTIEWTNTGQGPEAILVTAKGVLNPFLESGDSFVGGNYALNLPLAAGVDTRGHFWACFDILNGMTSHFYAIQFEQFDATTAQQFVAIARVQLPAPVAAMAFAQINGEDFVYLTTQSNIAGGGIVYRVHAQGASIDEQASWIPSTDPSSTAGPGYPAVDPTTGIVYIVSNPGGGAYEWNVTVWDPRGGGAQPAAFEFHGDAAHGQGLTCMFDSIDQSLIVFTTNGSIYKIDVATMTVIASAAAIVAVGFATNYPKWNCGTVPGLGLFVAQDASANLIYINHATLAIAQTVAEQEWFAATLGGGFTDAQLDPVTLSLVCSPANEAGDYGSFAFRIYLNRQAVPGETLDQIVSDICSRAGLTDDLIDVTALASTTVLGYPVTRNSDAKSILVPLVSAYFFDAVESDFVLKFVPRGGAVAMTIPEADLGLEADGFELQDTISQEHDLPKAIEVLYADPSLDYQTGKQRAARPARVVKTKTKSVLELPLTMDADTAAQIADIYIKTIWNERNPCMFKLASPKYLVLDSTDVVEVIYNSSPYVKRLIKNTIGQDFVTEFSSCSEDPEGYISTAKGNNGTGFPIQVINPAAPTTLYMLDLPLLADTDSPPAGSSGYYFAMASRTPGWPGGVLYNSPDAQNYGQVGFSNSAIVFGSVGMATPAPPAPSGPWVIDQTTKIRVGVSFGGVLSSTSLINLLNGANAFILGDEILQFQTATLNADKSYTLSNFLRGRRGTEWAASQHVSGETALFLPFGLHRNNVPTSLVGLSQYYEAATIGQSRTLASPQNITLQGNDLKPYAPCHILGARDGSNNLTLDWTRRTRLGGDVDWLDGVVDVPLSEASEAYSVDIVSSLGEIVRTFNSLTSPTVVYSAAEQTADGLTPGNPVNVQIFQISAAIGRGFAGVATV